MSYWSGLCSASSLPAETLQRMSMNARLVEHALQTPQPSISESFASRQFGMPVVAESLAGGAVQVSVNSFSRVQPGGRVVEPLDNWDRNHVAHGQFHEFFSGYVSGRLPVRESLPSYSRPVGLVSYGARNKQRNRPSGIPYWYQSLPGEPGFGEPSSMNRRNHPSYTFAGINRDGQEVYRSEDGGVVVGRNPALDNDGTEEEEERQRIKDKYLEAVEEAKDLGQAHESTIPVRESRGWKWCSTHQRWTKV